jgi:hypothetical protein
MLMKKLPYIILTSLIVVIAIGNFGLFQLFLGQYRSSIQFEIKNNIHKTTDVIYINPSELYSDNSHIKWEDGNNEIVYDGNLYDIVSITSEKGKVRINAISDKKETDYKLLYAQEQDQTNQASNSPIKLLKQFLSLKFTEIEVSSLSVDSYYTDVTLSVSNADYLSFHDGYYLMETPPPNSI